VAKPSYSEDVKRQVVLHALSSGSIKRTSEIFSISRPTVASWVKLHQDKMLVDVHLKGRKFDELSTEEKTDLVADMDSKGFRSSRTARLLGVSQHIVNGVRFRDKKVTGSNVDYVKIRRPSDPMRFSTYRHLVQTGQLPVQPRSTHADQY
jgi:transposase-like protein